MLVANNMAGEYNRMVVFKALLSLMGWIAIGDASAIDPEISPQCPANEAVCKVTWVLTQLETMVYYKGERFFLCIYLLCIVSPEAD